MLRFNPANKLSDNFYVRQDGTRAYYFSKGEFDQLVNPAWLLPKIASSLTILQLFIHAFLKIILGNRKTKAKQFNVFFNITTGTGIMNKIKLSRKVERLTWIKKDML